MPATALALKSRPEDLVGEIVEQHLAVLEYLGANRFLVYDMRAMRQTVVPLGADGVVGSWERPAQPLAVMPRADATPAQPLAVMPRADATPAQPLAVVPRADATLTRAPRPRRRVDTRRFEAAWFARGEQLQHEEDGAAEVDDYLDYQEELERLARELP